jgi:16S rRNA (guanine527-N7)-methyltransferase
MKAQTALLNSGIEALALQSPDSLVPKLLQYIQLLIKWNKAINLTAISDPERIITHHLLDSLAIAPYLKGSYVLDVGTGAGLPGIPLALAFPDYQFVLLDSQGKKIRFLTQVISELDLKNVSAVQARAENYTSTQCFDTILTRAVGSINDMISTTQHLVCSDGQLLLMKGRYPEAELAEVNRSDKEITIYPISVPQLDEQRHVVQVISIN